VLGRNYYICLLEFFCLLDAFLSTENIVFSPSLVVKYFYCRSLCRRGHPKCWRTVIPMSHLSSASLIIKFVIDASWLVPTTLSEVTSATILCSLCSSPPLNRQEPKYIQLTICILPINITHSIPSSKHSRWPVLEEQNLKHFVQCLQH